MSAVVEPMETRAFLRTKTPDPRVKVIYLAWVFIMVSLLTHPAGLLALLLIVLATVLASSLPFWTLVRAARFGLAVAAVSWVLWIAFLRSQGNVLVSWGPVRITAPGLFNGWSVAARIAGILLAFLLVFRTTPNREFMTALYRLRVSIPFAMVVGITLRLIPQLQAEHAIIMEAQRSRAVEFDQGNLIARMRKHMAYLVPLILRALKITSDLSLAMESRGFDPYAKRTFSNVDKLSATDTLLIAFMTVSFLLAVTARLAGFGGMPTEWLAR